MHALEPEVVDAVWKTVAGLITEPGVHHPVGCHRPRVSDRLCFCGILIRLVTGASWPDIEQILGQQVSDTTLRARRHEWIVAGVFDALKDEAVQGYDRIIGLDLSEVSFDRSLHKPRAVVTEQARTPPIEPNSDGNGRYLSKRKGPDRLGGRRSEP